VTAHRIVGEPQVSGNLTRGQTGSPEEGDDSLPGALQSVGMAGWRRHLVIQATERLNLFAA
jgi:hypothetical protein